MPMSILRQADPEPALARSIWIPLVGISIWLAFPNDFISFPPAVLLWPVGLYAIATTSRSFPEAMRKGWLASWAGIFACLYWLYLPLANVGELPVPLALACAALIAFCLAFQSAIFAGCAWLARRKPFLALAFGLPLLWYLLEYAFAKIIRFPWLPLTGALAQWPCLAQASAICGAYFLGALWLIAAFLSLFAFSGQLGPRMALSIAGFCAASILGYGAYKLSLATPETPTSQIMEAIIIEGNIDQNQKWDPAFQKASLDAYISLTDKALESQGPPGNENAIIVWPETALPFFFQRAPEFAAEVESAAARWHLPLLFGAPGVEELNGKDAIYNRAFLLDPEGQIIGKYDKEQLVPFGEYLPQWLNFKFLEALLQGVGIYSQGVSISPLRYGRLALGMLICYEGIFPWLAQARVEAGANMLVDISNDGWFGHTPAARQHLVLTSLRCIEQNRWLLRATNTGISCAIDPLGRIKNQGPMFQAGYLKCALALEQEQTIFHHVSALLPWLALVLALLLLLAAPGRRKW